MDFTATVAGSTDSAAPRGGRMWSVGAGSSFGVIWRPAFRASVGCGHGNICSSMMVREGFGGCQGRCGGRGPEGDGGPQGAPLREGRSASKALLGNVYSMDEVDTAIAALERRIPGKDAVRVSLKLS